MCRSRQGGVCCNKGAGCRGNCHPGRARGASSPGKQRATHPEASGSQIRGAKPRCYPAKPNQTRFLGAETEPIPVPGCRNRTESGPCTLEAEPNPASPWPEPNRIRTGDLQTKPRACFEYNTGNGHLYAGLVLAPWPSDRHRSPACPLAALILLLVTCLRREV